MMNGKFCGEVWNAVSRYVYTALQGGAIMKGWTNDDRMMRLASLYIAHSDHPRMRYSFAHFQKKEDARMKLVIAEKPSVTQYLAKVIGVSVGWRLSTDANSSSSGSGCPLLFMAVRRMVHNIL